MPSSLRSIIKKYNFQGKLTEEETNNLLKKLDNHDKELIKEFAGKLSKELIDFCEENIKEDDLISTSYIYIDFLGVKAMDGKTISYGVLDKLLKEYGIGEE